MMQGGAQGRFSVPRVKNKPTFWVEEVCVCLIGLYFMVFLGAAHKVTASQLPLSPIQYLARSSVACEVLRS